MDIWYSKPQEVPNGDCRRDFEANIFLFVLFKHQDALSDNAHSVSLKFTERPFT